MKLATVAAVMLITVAAAWTVLEYRKVQRAEKQCHALQDTVDALNGSLEFIAVLVERAPGECCRKRDAMKLRAKKVARPEC